MNNRVGRAGVILLLFLVSTTSFASSFTGPIQSLMSLKPANGPTRTVVTFLEASTGCVAFQGYAFENSDTGIGKVWTSFLLTAYSLGKAITIIGDGTCHTYPDIAQPGLYEGIQRIDLR